MEAEADSYLAEWRRQSLAALSSTAPPQNQDLS
jgi:hypothetical protein